MGRYLGPSIDVGTSLTVEIIKSNRQVLHRYIYRGLTLEEIESETEKEKHRQFDQWFTIKLGVKASSGYSKEMDIEETPTFKPYAENDRNEKSPDLPP